MKEQIPEKIKSERLEILQKELFQQQAKLNKSYVGKVLPILFERKGKMNNQLIGRSPYMQSVYVETNSIADIFGKLLPIKIMSASQNSLEGKLEN